ncbi:MAG: flagellar biosynthesis protein FlhF [Clostridia bacterium]|nr:flagellar biosynthesis protein FlhF [Clostridia bacterium]
MKIKRYEGRSETEVMEKIKEELGSDALILNVRRVEPTGFWRFFKSPTVEITATNDKLFTKTINKEKESKEDDENKNRFLDMNTDEVTNGADFARDLTYSIKNEGKKNTKETIKEDEEKLKSLEEKLDNMEILLKSVSDKLINETSKSEPGSKFKNNILQLFYDNMVKNEVLPEVAMEVLNGLDAVDERNNVNEMVRIVYNRIINMLGKPEEVKEGEPKDKPKVVAFVGPTGVGKTTTIAKIVAKFILNNKKKVGLLTADTYRIAAVEQLKTYAEILGCPIDVCYNADELKEKIDKNKDKELLFLDTAGRSHKNKVQFDELTSLLSTIDNKEVYLVLSLATKYKDMVEIINKYSEILESYRIIFTKMDETQGLGNILNVKVLTDKPCSYITFGQDVPEDIEQMNPEKIAKFLLGSFEN